ncbi:MAG: hypothetical protein RDU25_05515 [Patescibacteria group bacterium]|nr:hypothetical protein [Patescibacteria group bacterium]
MIKFDSSQHQCVLAAAQAVKTAREAGKVTSDTLVAVGAAVSLGIEPPHAFAGKRALVIEGVCAPAGSWPHYLAALVRAEEKSVDFKALEEMAKTAANPAKKEAARRAVGFYAQVFGGTIAGFMNAARAMERIRDREVAEAKCRASQAEEVARRASQVEANRQAEAARKAAEAAEEERRAAVRRSTLEAAEFNAQAPRVIGANGKPTDRRPGDHPRLSSERIRELLSKETTKREKDGMEPEQARLAAARFVFRIVFLESTDANNDYTDDEIEVFRSEIKSAVVAVHVRGGADISEAEREAEAWLNRAIAFERRALAGQQAATSNSPQAAPRRDKTRGQGQRQKKVGSFGELLVAAGHVADPKKAANGD